MINPTVGFIIGMPMIVVITFVSGLMDWKLSEMACYAIALTGLLITVMILNRFTI